MLTCYIFSSRGNLQTRVKCCRADASQILKSQILRNIFKPCFPIWKCICASTSPCLSWCMHGSTRILSSAPRHCRFQVSFWPAPQPGAVLAESTESQSWTMSLHSHSCIWFSPPKNFPIFRGFCGDGYFNTFFLTRNWIDDSAHQSRKVHTKSSSLPLVSWNTPFPPPEKPNLWQWVG